MAILTRKRIQFAPVPSKLISDLNISHGAFRTYSYLLSKANMPNGWEYFNNDIKKQIGIKDKDTIAKYLKELRENNWVERKRNNKTNGYDYILNDDNTYTTSKRYEDLENQAKENPQALFLLCQNLLADYEFSIPANRLDLSKSPTLHYHLRMDENGYFRDLKEELIFNEEKARLVWAYLWQDRFNEVMIYIKQKRR